jgi:hypothetical protein
MSIEDPTKQDLPLEQPDMPVLEVTEPEVNEEKSPIKIRTHRNPERGTELTYVTIPIDKIEKIDEVDIEKILRKYFGENINYGEIITQIKTFLATNEKEFIITVWDKENMTGGYLKIKKNDNKIIITPAPAIHNIGGYGKNEKGEHYASLRKNQFDDIISILDKSFKSHSSPSENAYRKRDKNHRINYAATGIAGLENRNEGITKGDVFSLEIFPEKWWDDAEEYDGINHGLRVLEASPKRISSINIQMNDKISSEKKEEKMIFYKQQLEKYKIPVRFFDIDKSDSNKPIYTRIFPKP